MVWGCSVPRGQNTEADDLTNNRCEAFGPVKRVDVDLAALPWIILPQLRATRDEYESKLEEARACKEAVVPGRLPAAKRPRVTDPW